MPEHRIPQWALKEEGWHLMRVGKKIVEGFGAKQPIPFWKVRLLVTEGPSKYKRVFTNIWFPPVGLDCPALFKIRNENFFHALDLLDPKAQPSYLVKPPRKMDIQGKKLWAYTIHKWVELSPGSYKYDGGVRDMNGFKAIKAVKKEKPYVPKDVPL